MSKITTSVIKRHFLLIVLQHFFQIDAFVCSFMSKFLQTKSSLIKKYSKEILKTITRYNYCFTFILQKIHIFLVINKVNISLNIFIHNKQKKLQNDF